MSARLRSALYAAVPFAGYVLLGLAVSHAPLSGLDRAGEALFGHGVGLALLFTRLGMAPAYLVLCAALLVFGLVRREWLSRVLYSIAALIGAWGVSDAGKAFFMRPRPEHWLAIHETSYSYASGHATLSLVFYGIWVRFLLRSRLPVALRRVLAACLMVLIISIGWSRAVLGAHYITDILGGYALGSALLCAAALYRPIKAWA